VTKICAWCQKEGVITILDGNMTMAQAVKDINDQNVSHGICQRHAAQALADYYKAKEQRDAKPIQ
jgi:hypothetical protein